MHKQITDRAKMIEIGLAGLIGLLVGVAGTLFANQPPKEPTEKIAQVQQEVIQQLTDLDVIKEICNPEHTQTKEGMLL